MALTDAQILQRRNSYACCSLSYLAEYVDAQRFGDKDCMWKSRALWLKMLWAKSVADRTPLSTETFGKCVTHEFAELAFKDADCFCSQCNCPAEDCSRTPSYEAIAAVNVSERAVIETAGPAVGDTYLVTTGIDDGVWAVGYVEIWNGTGWDSILLPADQFVLIAGRFWRMGQGGIPGLADPTVTATSVGPPDLYTIVSDYPSIALNSSRFAYILAFGPGGWEIVMQTPEVNLATPIPLPIVGYSMSNVSAIYVGGRFGGPGECETSSGDGSIYPPGCFIPRDHDCSDHDLSDHG